MKLWRVAFAVWAFAVLFAPVRSAWLPVETLRATGSLPARLVENIESPRAYVETSTGIALVLDGSAQAIYAISPASTRACSTSATTDG